MSEKPKPQQTLRSPTCYPCTQEHSLAVLGLHTVWPGTCANCGRKRMVSSLDDWSQP